jgi:AmpE protein
MSFLTVLLAYLLSRYTTLSNVLQQDGWFNAAMTHLSARHPGSALTFWLLVPMTSLLMAALVWWLPYWFGFLLSIVSLLYSLGRGPWREYVFNAFQKIKAGLIEHVWLTLRQEGHVETGNDTLWTAIRRRAAYSYLNDLFAVMFWFCLLGPAGALFYRLLSLFNKSKACASGLIPAQIFWQRTLEWLPARYMGLCFCLAGDFSRCFWVWRELFFDTQLDTHDFLCRCIDAALVVESDLPDQYDSIEQEQIDQALRYSGSLQDLLIRTEIIGLVGLALAVLIFI